MSANTDMIRNIAVTGHGSTGKTSFVEHLLAAAGSIPKPESVDTGKTVSDFTDEEISRKSSIHTSLSHLMWKDKKINVLDTPGASDFVGEVVAALRVAETAVVLAGAEVGVQIGTIQVWRRLQVRRTPRLVFVNKMEKEHADFVKVLTDLKDKFSANFVPLALPIGASGSYKGVIDLIAQKAYLNQEDGKTAKAEAIPADMQDQADEYRQALIEAAAEGDDALMEKFFEEETLSEAEILQGLRSGMKNGSIVPVLAGSALLGSGVNIVLDTIAAIAPSPAGQEEPVVGEGEEDVSKKVDPQGKPSCFVFKTSIDQFSGKLSFVKVVSGTVAGDSELINSRTSDKLKIGKVYTCQGKKLEETDSLESGDVGILTKLNAVTTNDSLCTAGEAVTYKALRLPSPVHAVAISATAKKDEDKLNQMLQRAAEEDLTFQISYNRETRETVISGMGELHLDIIMNKIKTQQKIDMNTKVPKVAYRETIRAASGAEYQHKKQTGGHGQYAKVMLEIKPIARGEQFSFVNGIVGGRISKGYIPGVEKGVIEGMQSGSMAGYPVVDLEAKVVDGKEHPVDSSEMAFKLAARGALRAAMEKANPVLLEPVMRLNVFVDDQYLGDVLSDLSSRRGKVLGQEPLGGGIQEVKAQVPQAELLRYSIDLRSITSGTASFEMEFDHYEAISGKVAEEVIKAAQAAKEEAEGAK
jgi:elongation factor G